MKVAFTYGQLECDYEEESPFSPSGFISNDNENTTTQNLWDVAKAVLRWKFIAIKSYLKKQGKHRIDNLTLHLKQLEKKEQKNLKISRRKENIKI